jgi:hypothetical protein
MSLDNTDPLQPILLGPNAGEARWWGDSLAIIKASAETSAGRIAVIDNYRSRRRCTASPRASQRR